MLCFQRFKLLPPSILLLIAFGGCAWLNRDFTPDELAQRLHYDRDTNLEELVHIAVTRGYRAVDDEEQVRQVVELSRSDPGAVHRQFFEVQPRDAAISDVFFLENKGSVDQTDLRRFPKNLRKDISKFLEWLPESRSHKYKPLLLQQAKLVRTMIIYETGDGGRALEFSSKVVSLEKSTLYGVFRVPSGPFVFFGKESNKLSRKDFLEADKHYHNLVREFLEVFRQTSTL